jgi:hypothetical protein
MGQILPQSPQQESTLDTLILDSDFQYCEKISICCFKPPSFEIVYEGSPKILTQQLHNSYLEGGHTGGKLKLWLVKKHELLPLARRGGILGILWLGQCSYFICVQMWLWKSSFSLSPSQSWSGLVWCWWMKLFMFNRRTTRPSWECQASFCLSRAAFFLAEERLRKITQKTLTYSKCLLRGCDKWLIYFSCLLRICYCLSDLKMYVFIPRNTLGFSSEHTGNKFILWQMN